MLYTNRYLVHHGIKGQKWGVRRFENPDGTLTEAGKKRYNKEQTKSRNKEYDESRSTMSDKDLDTTITRLKKENELHKLTNPGKTYINDCMKDVGKKVIITAASGAALYAGKYFVSKFLSKKKDVSKMSDDELSNMINRIKKEDELNKLLNPHFDAGDLANAIFNGGAKKK